MNMKRLLTLVAFFATVHASAQQVNPVPDYVFANRMSAGRNTVTDTAAYFSIGPRYGATRGMMPPMVVDTASFSGNRRNGLLIFSVQKNKFLYWDSVGIKWAEMAGTGGIALTSGDTAALLSTRAWRQKGIDSLAAIRIGGSGTTSYIPKFTASTTLGNSVMFESNANIGIGTTTPYTKLSIQTAVDQTAGPVVRLMNNANIIDADQLLGGFEFYSGDNDTGGDTVQARITASQSSATTIGAYLSFSTKNGGSVTTERLRITQDGDLGVGRTNPSYKLDLLVNKNGVDGYNVYGQQGGASEVIGYRAQQANGIGLVMATTGASATSAFGGANQSVIYTEGNQNLIFGTNTTRAGSINSGQEWLLTDGTDNGNYKLQVTGNIFNTGSITTGAPSGGSIKPWKIGEAATVSPTSPNRTLRVEVDGVVYYIHAKTTND